MPSRAIIYVVYGKEYLKEALRSIESVNGQFPCVVCRPGNWQSSEIETFDLPLRKYEHWFLDRVNYFNLILNSLDYDQLLFLDADTYVCGDLTDWFTILDRYDMAATQAIAQQTLQRDDIPASFPELHCGAMAVNNNQNIIDLFQTWFNVYQWSPIYFGNDQPPLRQTLWYGDCPKLAILPAEFCFRYRWGGLLSRQVRILHGHEHGTPYEKIAKEVNSSTDIRIYHKRELA